MGNLECVKILSVSNSVSIFLMGSYSSALVRVIKYGHVRKESVLSKCQCGINVRSNLPMNQFYSNSARLTHPTGLMLLSIFAQRARITSKSHFKRNLKSVNLRLSEKISARQRLRDRRTKPLKDAHVRIKPKLNEKQQSKISA